MNDAPEFQLTHPPAGGELAALQKAPQDGVMNLISQVIERGITQENVAALEKLADLYERLQDKDAERQFAAAFVALQAEIPGIEATKPVPNKDGTIRYRFAPYEVIMEAVRPVLLKHGFTLTFSSDVKEGRVIQTCTLQHVGGHKRSNSFGARIGHGPPGASEAQGDGAASSFAKRYALCDALNIVIETDQDARAEGSATPITKDEAHYLKELVAETKSDEAAFLKFSGAATYAEIGADRYDRLAAMLHKKQRA